MSLENFRYAYRNLLATPGFGVTAILSVGIGIGGNLEGTGRAIEGGTPRIGFSGYNLGSAGNTPQRAFELGLDGQVVLRGDAGEDEGEPGADRQCWSKPDDHAAKHRQLEWYCRRRWLPGGSNREHVLEPVKWSRRGHL